MRIGVLTTSFPRFEQDPTGSFVRGLTRALAKRGHEMEVIVPEPRLKPDWDRKQESISVFPVPYARPRALERLFFEAGVPDNLARAPGLAALIPPAVAGLGAYAALRSRRWDAALSHWLVPSGLLAGLVCRRRIPHLAIAHSGDVALLKKLPAGASLTRVIVGLSHHLGCISNSLRSEICDLLPDSSRADFLGRSSVTPMGVNLARLRSPRSRAENRRRHEFDGFTVLFIGRLVHIKGVDLLLEASRKLGIPIVIAGDGPERQSLEQLADTKGLHARFVGMVDSRTRAELLSACDAVVIPSRVLPSGRHEGLPLVLVESLASGRPVIATDSGAIRELVVDGETGLLVPPNDPVALENAIGELKSNTSLASRIAEAGVRQVADRDWNRLAPIYERLLLTKGGAENRNA